MVHVDVFVLRSRSPSLTGIQWFFKKFTLSLKQRKKEERFFWKNYEIGVFTHFNYMLAHIIYTISALSRKGSWISHIHRSKFVHCLTLLWLKTFWKRNTIKCVSLLLWYLQILSAIVWYFIILYMIEMWTSV